jgi:hypothetical protein
MTKRATPPAEFVQDTLPGELPSFEATETSGDSSQFVTFEEIGQTFDGMFLRNVDKGENDLEFPASLYAEYPSGNLKLIPYGWSQGQEQEKQNDKERDWSRTVQRMTLSEIKVKDEGTKKEKRTKLFEYGYMTLTEAQADKFRASIKFTDTWKA